MKKRVFQYLFSACLIGLTQSVAFAEPADLMAQRQELVGEMVEEHGFDATELSALLNQAIFRQDIIDAMERPAEAKPWYQYRPIFLTEQRIRGGAQFWQEHSELLRQAEAEFGVPPEIITAIIGVETRYGGFTGKHRILDSLNTLAFGYPKRAKFFRNELKEFLVLCREERIDPLTAKGSYAGAMGLPQFIASSYRKYAVDFDKDGKRDLWNSDADIIGSVANYFHEHGWQPKEPVIEPARGASGKNETLIEAGLKPSLSAIELRRAGIEVNDATASLEPLSLLKFERSESENEYWLGLANFYVITRYNISKMYAMAVYQLSGEIRDLHQRAALGFAFD